MEVKDPKVMFVSCCHLCGEKTVHDPEAEGATMGPFYKRHLKCLRQYSGNVTTEEKYRQWDEWMEAEDDGGYKEVCLWKGEGLPAEKCEEISRWLPGKTVVRKLPPGSVNSRKRLAEAVQEEVRQVNAKSMKVGTRVQLAWVDFSGEKVNFFMWQNEGDPEEYAIAQRFVYDLPSGRYRGMLWLDRKGEPYRAEYGRSEGTEEEHREGVQQALGSEWGLCMAKDTVGRWDGCRFMAEVERRTKEAEWG